MIELEKLEKPDVLEEKQEEWTEEYRDWLDDEDVPEAAKRRYNHDDIKERLIEETKRKCAYCESKISNVTFEHVEHIKPKSKYTDLIAEWNNLTITCPKCNVNKGDKYNEKLPFINPYEDKPQEHLDAYGPMVTPRTKRGKFTKNVLRMNRVGLLENRRDKLESIDNLIDILENTDSQEECLAILSVIENKLSRKSEYSFVKMIFAKERLEQIDIPCSLDMPH
jgi:hypothetical protein